MKLLNIKTLCVSVTHFYIYQYQIVIIDYLTLKDLHNYILNNPSTCLGCEH